VSYRSGVATLRTAIIPPEASVSTRAFGSDPTTFDVCWVQPSADPSRLSGRKVSSRMKIITARISQPKTIKNSSAADAQRQTAYTIHSWIFGETSATEGRSEKGGNRKGVRIADGGHGTRQSLGKNGHPCLPLLRCTYLLLLYLVAR